MGTIKDEAPETRSSFAKVSRNRSGIFSILAIKGALMLICAGVTPARALELGISSRSPIALETFFRTHEPVVLVGLGGVLTILSFVIRRFWSNRDRESATSAVPLVNHNLRSVLALQIHSNSLQSHDGRQGIAHPNFNASRSETVRPAEMLPLRIDNLTTAAIAGDANDVASTQA